jgi:hypothetical protein
MMYEMRELGKLGFEFDEQWTKIRSISSFTLLLTLSSIQQVGKFKRSLALIGHGRGASARVQ